MKRVHVMTAAILAAVMSVGGAAMAQGARGDGLGRPGRDGGPGGRGRGGVPIASLNLTQAQQDLVRDIRQRYSNELEAVETRSRAAHEAQRKAIEAIPLNEAAIRSTTLALAETQAEAAILQARLQNEVFAALTPEQQARLKELRTEREKRLQERQANAPQRRN